MPANSEIDKLFDTELDAVTGGMNFDWPEHYMAGAQGKNIIDATGGDTKVWGFNVTHDGNGNVSSVTRT